MSTSIRTSKPRVVHVSVVALLVLLTGCERDTASDAADPGGLPRFELGAEPSLVLADDGSEEKLFSRVEARRLPGGELVVADYGGAVMHVFGRDGALVRTLARRGKGPGELEGFARLVAHGDTVVLFGHAPMSPPDMHVFTATGFVSRSRPETDSLRMLTVSDRLGTGELVVQRGAAIRIIDSPPQVGTTQPDTVTYGLYSVPPGEARGRVTWLPAVVRLTYYAYPWRGSRIGSGLAPFDLAPTTMVAAVDDRLWLVDGGTGQVWAVDGTGRKVARGRLSLEARPFDVALLERRRAAALDTARRELDSAKVQATYDPAIRPATMPLASAAHAGPDGELWVRVYDLDDTAPQRFVVVDRDGTEIARAEIPAGFDVQHVGRDFVLGVRHDSLGVPSVVEYALRRP
jgi:hypothetical protein